MGEDVTHLSERDKRAQVLAITYRIFIVIGTAFCTSSCCRCYSFRGSSGTVNSGAIACGSETASG